METSYILPISFNYGRWTERPSGVQILCNSREFHDINSQSHGQNVKYILAATLLTCEWCQVEIFFWKKAMRQHQKPSHGNAISHCAHISVALKLSKILQWLWHRLCFGNYPLPVFAVQLATHTEVFFIIFLLQVNAGILFTNRS